MTNFTVNRKTEFKLETHPSSLCNSKMATYSCCGKILTRIKKGHCSRKDFFKNTIILFVVPPQFCINIVFNFSWGNFSPKRNWKQCLCKIVVFLKKSCYTAPCLCNCFIQQIQVNGRFTICYKNMYWLLVFWNKS